jgi:hypothetical protein
MHVAWDRKEKRYEDNIERYHLQVNCVSSPFRIAKYFPASTTQYSIENLKPDTTYLVMIQAFSDDRWGPWSEPVTLRTCAPCIPILARRGEDFVQVRWESEYYKRCSVEPSSQKYQIRVRKAPVDAVDGGQSSVPPTEESILDLDTPAHRFGHLAAFSRLVLQIRCFDFTLQSWCQWGRETEFRTLPAVIVLTHVGETHAEISWPRVPQLLSAVTDEQAISGVEDPLSPDAPKQYVIRVNRVDGNKVHREIAKHHFDSSEATAFAITELEADMDFSVQLTYLDIHDRWSNHSSPVAFRTMPALRVAVRDVGEGYASLRWGRWHSGTHLVSAGNDDDLNFRIQLHRVLSSNDEENQANNTVPQQYNVQGKTSYVATGLKASTLYRVHVSCASKTSNVWGRWSEPAYLRTTNPPIMDVDLIGQDFAVVSWQRPARDDDVSNQLPGAQFVLADFNNKTPLPQISEAGHGSAVHYGDDTVVEHHLNVFRVDLPVEPALDPKPLQTLIFDVKRNPGDTTVRIPALAPNTQYIAVVRSMFASKHWGVWSSPLDLRTTMPTKVRISDIAQDGMTLTWGNVDESVSNGSDSRVADLDTEKHELRIDGIDDGFTLTVQVEGSVHSYTARGLRPNARYSFTVRSFLLSDRDWGTWCDKIYVKISTTPLSLVEASQDWLHVKWDGKAPPDGRPKAQFLTVIGEGRATIEAIPASQNSHVVPKLSPNTRYVAHMLCVEQLPTYWTPEAEPKLVAEPSTTEEASSKNHSKDALAGVSFSLPLVSSESGFFVASGIALRTYRLLEAQIDRVGQNFVLVRWSVKREAGDSGEELHVPGELFEVETVTLDGSEEPRFQRAHGTYVFVRHLRPDTDIRCAVRTVASRTNVACSWSNHCTVRLLPMIDPVLGPGDGSDVPGVGEDYAIVNWSRALAKFSPERLQGISFEVRINPLEGPTAHVEQTFETMDPRYHCVGLLPDTKYQIQVRTVIAHRSSDGGEEVAKGEWSRPLVTTTLSPMAVCLVDITETTSFVHWRRRNCAQAAEGDWWAAGDEETRKAEISTISSFHVRVFEASALDSPAFYDEQFGEHHSEFQSCRAGLRGLKPNTAYIVTVRASTGRLWGGWSTNTPFTTVSPVSVASSGVAESSVIVRWERPSVNAEVPPAIMRDVLSPAMLAPVTSWEVKFAAVGQDGSKPITCSVASEHSLQRLGGLLANTAYAISVRAVYLEGLRGPWSDAVYCVTLPSLRVDVGKVGETFVNVSWSREAQQTLTARMKSRNLDAERRLDQQLRELEQDRQALAETAASEDPAAVVDATRRMEAIDVSISNVQQKSRQSKKLISQHCAELEQVTAYGVGDDTRYEMVVYVGSFGRGHDESVQPQVLLKKRLGRNETRYRLENLTPQTSYFVVVRALHVSADKQVSSNLRQSIGDVDDDTGAPWGEWSEKTTFVTLKPITINAHGVGSSSFSVEWDTGIESSSSSKKTAISKFQIKCVDAATQKPAVPDVILSDSALKGHVVPDLEPSTAYSVSVRVCYEGDKWGVWSAPVQFMTLPPLIAKLEATSERQMDFLVWRDAFPTATDPATLLWRPRSTKHQLAINDVPCDDTFEIEEGTSTALTLDTLSLDTEYVISIRDEIDGIWQQFKPALVSETLPHVPQRPQLVERKGTCIAISWEHRRLLEERQYLYMLEIALLADPRKGRKSEVGAFQTLGFTTDSTFRLDLPYPIHSCVFRVRAAKTNLTVDGSPMYVNGFVPGKPAPGLTPVVIDNPHLYRWSGLSPIAHFKTPSVPDHPTGIHVRNLTHNAAHIRWQRPGNHTEHTELVYRVYLNNSYVDRFTCISETTDCNYQLDDLVPNTHYRVAVTAESTMGRSINNNTLHFSTRGIPAPGDRPTVQRKPMASTLPPRPVLKPPANFVDRAAKERSARQSSAEVGDVLIDDAGSTIYGAVGRSASATTGHRATQGQREVERPATTGTAEHGKRNKRQLPPLPADTRKGL